MSRYDNALYNAEERGREYSGDASGLAMLSRLDAAGQRRCPSQYATLDAARSRAMAQVRYFQGVRMFFDLVGEDELDPIRSAAAAEGRDTAIPVGHFWRVIVHTPDPLDDEAYCLQFGVVPIDWPTDHLVEFIFDLVE